MISKILNPRGIDGDADTHVELLGQLLGNRAVTFSMKREQVATQEGIDSAIKLVSHMHRRLGDPTLHPREWWDFAVWKVRFDLANIIGNKNTRRNAGLQLAHTHATSYKDMAKYLRNLHRDLREWLEEHEGTRRGSGLIVVPSS